VSSAISYILSGYLTVTLVLLLSLILAWNALDRPKGIPPGPRGIPLLGYLPFFQMMSKTKLLAKLQKKYGSIFSMYFEKQLVVFLQDYDSVHKAYVEQGDNFTGRPDDGTFVVVPEDKKSLGVNEGHFWREHRRFALSTFRDFGAGKASMEPQILNEIHYFLEEVSRNNGEPFHMHRPLSRSVSNNICAIIYGKRFDYNDPQFNRLLHLLDEALTCVSKIPLHHKFPWLRYISCLENFHKYKTMMQWGKEMIIFSHSMIAEAQKNLTPGKCESYIDVYLNERNDREKTKSEPELFDLGALSANVRGFFNAGTETTTTTLEWAILFMILHPDIQRKVHLEIDDVIGQERTPTAEDRLKMPYTEATLLEASRRGSIVPFNLPHVNIDEATLKGFRIPKRTMIITNLYAVHHDEKLFPDPFSFRPERFINAHGQFVKSEHVIPFSIGKRFCLGEPLARMELFLYFTSMLQKFTFKNPEGQVLTTDSEPDFINTAPKYNVQAIRRS